MNPADTAAVQRQLHRAPRGDVAVAVRCACGLPGVIETGAVVDDAPFPTMYWLTCVRAIREIGRLEGAGRIREVNERLASDENFAAAFALAQADHIRRRGVPVGGGSIDRVKCLHAHYAHHLATGRNPVGEWVAGLIGDVLRPPSCA